MISLGSEPCKKPTTQPSFTGQARRGQAGSTQPASSLQAQPENAMFSLSGALTPVCHSNCPHKMSTKRMLPIIRALEACLPYLAVVPGEDPPPGAAGNEPG